MEVDSWRVVGGELPYRSISISGKGAEVGSSVASRQHGVAVRHPLSRKGRHTAACRRTNRLPVGTAREIVHCVKVDMHRTKKKITKKVAKIYIYIYIYTYY